MKQKKGEKQNKTGTGEKWRGEEAEGEAKEREREGRERNSCSKRGRETERRMRGEEGAAAVTLLNGALFCLALASL